MLRDQSDSLESSVIDPRPQEFRKDRGIFIIRMKRRKAMSQGDDRDLFGGGETESDGANPGAERAADQLRNRDRENLKQALCDEPEYD